MPFLIICHIMADIDIFRVFRTFSPNIIEIIATISIFHLIPMNLRNLKNLFFQIFPRILLRFSLPLWTIKPIFPKELIAEISQIPFFPIFQLLNFYCFLPEILKSEIKILTKSIFYNMSSVNFCMTQTASCF